MSSQVRISSRYRTLLDRQCPVGMSLRLSLIPAFSWKNIDCVRRANSTTLRTRIDEKVSAFLRTRSDLITIRGRLVRYPLECDNEANECIEFGVAGLVRVRELPRDHLICFGPESCGLARRVRYFLDAHGPSSPVLPGAHEQRPHNCPDLPLLGPQALPPPHTADSSRSYHRLSIIFSQSF
ncbi:hypothetical protein CBL_00022 [Carabus blaptoides fortunei]